MLSVSPSPPAAPAAPAIPKATLARFRELEKAIEESHVADEMAKEQEPILASAAASLSAKKAELKAQEQASRRERHRIEDLKSTGLRSFAAKLKGNYEAKLEKEQKQFWAHYQKVQVLKGEVETMEAEHTRQTEQQTANMVKAAQLKSLQADMDRLLRDVFEGPTAFAPEEDEAEHRWRSLDEQLKKTTETCDAHQTALTSISSAIACLEEALPYAGIATTYPKAKDKAVEAVTLVDLAMGVVPTSVRSAKFKRLRPELERGFRQAISESIEVLQDCQPPLVKKVTSLVKSKTTLELYDEHAAKDLHALRLDLLRQLAHHDDDNISSSHNSIATGSPAIPAAADAAADDPPPPSYDFDAGPPRPSYDTATRTPVLANQDDKDERLDVSVSNMHLGEASSSATHQPEFAVAVDHASEGSSAGSSRSVANDDPSR
ncbi:hypothetical protein RI367_000411 [Sorochytrium milnesiophthora]